jgi:N4-gp56 family major capsid protein
MASTGLAANTNYGDANDDLNMSIMIMTSGAAKGEARTITNYVTSGGVITLTNGFDMTPEVDDTFRVCTPDEITTGDDLSYANMKKARTILKKNLANTYRGGYFVMVAGPDAYGDLMDDADWKKVMTYKDQTQGLFDGEVGKFAGIRCVETTSPFVFPIIARGDAGTAGGPGNNGANFDVTGHVQTALVFGKNAFGVTTFKKRGGQAIKPPIIIKPVGSGGSSDPLNRYGTVGWQIEIGHKALYPLHAVGIWCYYA